MNIFFLIEHQSDSDSSTTHVFPGALRSPVERPCASLSPSCVLISTSHTALSGTALRKEKCCKSPAFDIKPICFTSPCSPQLTVICSFLHLNSNSSPDSPPTHLPDSKPHSRPLRRSPSPEAPPEDSDDDKNTYSDRRHHPPPSSPGTPTLPPLHTLGKHDSKPNAITFIDARPVVPPLTSAVPYAYPPSPFYVEHHHWVHNLQFFLAFSFSSSIDFLCSRSIIKALILPQLPIQVAAHSHHPTITTCLIVLRQQTE